MITSGGTTWVMKPREAFTSAVRMTPGAAGAASRMGSMVSVCGMVRPP